MLKRARRYSRVLLICGKPKPHNNCRGIMLCSLVITQELNICFGRIRHDPPTAWFLPGPERMRGGAALQFASDRHFHRGIQAEATCRVILEKATRYQRLAESRPWLAGFFCGIQGIHFVEATTPEASQRKPPSWKPLNPDVFFI